MGILLQQLLCHHDEARGAKAALEGAGVDEGLLDRIERFANGKRAELMLMELALGYFVICLGGIKEPPRLQIHFTLGASGANAFEGLANSFPIRGLFSVSPQIPA